MPPTLNSTRSATQSDDDEADFHNATTILDTDNTQRSQTSNDDDPPQEAEDDTDPEEAKAQCLAYLDTLCTRPDDATPAPILDAILTTTAQDQWTACADMDSFLSDVDKSPVDINDDDRLIPCMIALPNHKIRFLYGLGYFTGGLNRHNHNLKHKFIALSGEGADPHHPQPLVLPNEALQYRQLLIPTATDLMNLVTSPTTYPDRHWFSASSLRSPVTARLPGIMPIPACVLATFDLNMDYNPWNIYTAIETIQQGQPNATVFPQWAAIKCWLRATTVKATKQNPQLVLPADLFMDRPSPDCIRWTTRRLATLLPNLHQPKPSPTAHPSRFTFPDEIKHIIEQSRVASPTTTNTTTASPTDTDTNNALGLADIAYDDLLRLCGLSPGEDDELPTLWTSLYASRIKKSDQRLIVRKALRSNLRYVDAEIPTTTTLVDMIIERNFSGDGMCTFVTATKGLSPFLAMPLPPEDIADLEEQSRALELATHTSVGDLEKQAKTLRARTPDSFHELTRTLRSFSNLLLTITGPRSTLLQRSELFYTTLARYSTTAQNTMTTKTMAGILWALFVETRHICNGEDDETNEPTGQYRSAWRAIDGFTAVDNGNLPAALYKRKQEDIGNIPQRERKQDRPPHNAPTAGDDIRHDCIKKALDPIIKSTPNLTVWGITQGLGIKQTDLLPAGTRGYCLKRQIFGRCYHACRHKHKRLTDDQAKQLLTTLTPIVKDPSKIKQPR